MDIITSASGLKKLNFFKATFILSMIILTFSCGPGRPPAEQGVPSRLESPVHQEFFDNLSELCNQSFRGTQIYRSHHAPGWAAQELVMHVEVCEQDHIYIPFHIGEDRSRTWIFVIEDGRLRFRHDHSHEDGTPEDETLYGGYADDSGTAFVQHFPADDYTAKVIEGGEGNIWTVSISENFSIFSYRLERDGEKRLRVDFDLTRPL
jgi:hypothetical protein